MQSSMIQEQKLAGFICTHCTKRKRLGSSILGPDRYGIFGADTDIGSKKKSNINILAYNIIHVQDIQIDTFFNDPSNVKEV